ncbi:hypothetical protein Vadar_021753 [Vaccinium darrowii]|uniref:Uncharacterized protein n=1 Tax=Vaccinium darrowii TaxID=229202 RepID=A0ACB7XSX1_9ERIC|nr:hypothetical protein Vadar_021753 [Vaccinium darrowii]
MLGLFRPVYLLQLSDGDDELCLWNPFSRMFQKFSPPEPSGTTLYGLGYDSVSDDYKFPTTYLLLKENLKPVYLLQLSDGDDELCLWNPFSRMFQKFSPPEPSGTTLYGLGYDSVSDDYKVVRVTRPYNNDPCVVHLFSSRLSSWKRIG